MQTREMLAELLRLGHGNNPLLPAGITEKDLDTLTMADKPSRNMVASYQQFFKSRLDELSAQLHNRPARIDGEVGPAFIALLSEPRCGFPDYPYPEGVLFAEALEANWPTTCRGKLKFGRNFPALPGLTKDQTDQVWHAICNILTNAFTDIEMTPAPVGVTTGVHIYAKLEALAGSTLAYSYLAQNRCDITLGQAYNSKITWNVRQAVTVGVHECKHALGSHHVQDPDATLFPSIHARSLARYGHPNTSDIRALVNLGYKSSGKPRPDDTNLFLPRDQAPAPVPSANPFNDFRLIHKVTGQEFVIVPAPKF
jgi:hypothetical protein